MHALIYRDMVIEIEVISILNWSSERLERHRSQRAFDIGNHQQVFVDEMIHILGLGVAEFQQQVIFVTGRIRL